MANENSDLDLLLTKKNEAKNLVGKLALASKPLEAFYNPGNELEPGRATNIINIPTGSVVMVIEVSNEKYGRTPHVKQCKFKILHNEKACYVSGRYLRPIAVEDVFKGKSFCITGTLTKPREYFKNFIKLKGGKFKPSLSSTVDYLICGSQTRAVGKSTKQKKAEKLKIPIITEHQFYKMFT